MDALERLLAIPFKSAKVSRWENRAPWGISVGPSESVQFHAVRSGHCWVRLRGESPILVEAGDFILVANGDACEYFDDPRTPTSDVRALLKVTPPGQTRPFPGDGPLTEFVCGFFRFEDMKCHPILRVLPRFVHLRRKENTALEAMLELTDRELREPRPASSVTLRHLGSILFVEAIRTYMRSLGPLESGLLDALTDPAIGAVLAAVYSEPFKNWTLDDLASRAALSRASLTRQFRASTGMSVRGYLTQRRMIAAVDLMGDRRLSLAQVALQVGYGSEVAFSHAFHNYMGRPPGEFRSGLQSSP